MDENQQSAPKVADQLVDMLAGAGIKRLYAITGDSLNEVTDAIVRDGRVKFVHMRHEESAAFAASAEAQLTGSLAACAGSSGPGHVHLVNGLYDAQRSGAPVLAIASTCPSSMYGTGYFQETDPALLFANCSVYNQPATTPAQFPVMLQGAMQEAVSRKGVGVIALPADLTGETAVQSITSTRPYVSERLPEPSQQEIDEAVKLIDGATKVAIYAGCGAAGAVDDLIALAGRLKAPVATTFKSTMMLTKDNPYYVGHIGYLGMWSAIEAINEADVTILIGQNFPFAGDFPNEKKLIQVDVKAERLGRRANLALGVRADAGAFMRALVAKVQPKEDDAFLNAALANWHTIQQRMMEPVENPGREGAIRPEYMVSTLNRLAADDAVFTVDTGMNCVWASHYLEAKGGRQMVGSFTHGSMANAMPMAIGAQMTFPQRQVVALCGDGGLAMLMGDMLTIKQYNLPVKLLVADNRSLAYVKWEMELAGIEPNETQLVNPDFATMARSMGYEAWQVTSPADLEGAMKQWLAAKGPALLSVVTDTDAASFTFDRDMMAKAEPDHPVENFRLPGA